MKTVIWIVFVGVALLWTGTAALLAELVQWSARGLAAVDGASIGSAAVTAPMPSWLGPWLDPASWSALQQAAAGTLAGVMAALPTVGSAVGWLVPAVWLTWGLGLLTLLGVTALALFMLRRLAHGNRPRLQVI